MKKQNIFWGLLCILGAAALLVYQLGFFADNGLRGLLFAVPLAAIMGYSIIHRMFYGIFFSAGLIIYIFKAQLGIPDLRIWVVMVAASLLGAGCSMIFGEKHHHFHAQGSFGSNGEDFPEEELGDNETLVETRFGSASKYLYSQCLEKVAIRASFAGIKVFFDQARLSPDGAILQFDCQFSGIELYIPRNWRVVTNANVALGGIEEKRGIRPEIGPDSPTLTLTGNLSLGGVEIIYM